MLERPCMQYMSKEMTSQQLPLQQANLNTATYMQAQLNTDAAACTKAQAAALNSKQSEEHTHTQHIG